MHAQSEYHRKCHAVLESKVAEFQRHLGKFGLSRHAYIRMYVHYAYLPYGCVFMCVYACVHVSVPVCTCVHVYMCACVHVCVKYA